MGLFLLNPVSFDHTCDTQFVFSFDCLQSLVIFLSTDLIQRVLLDLLGRHSSHWLGGTGLWRSVEVPGGQHYNGDGDCGHVLSVLVMYLEGWKMSFIVWVWQHKVILAPTWTLFLSLKGDVLTNVANLQTYGAVVVYVKYPENLLEVLLRTPVGHDIQNNHEFPEVYMTVLQGIQLQNFILYPVFKLYWLDIWEGFNNTFW